MPVQTVDLGRGTNMDIFSTAVAESAKEQGYDAKRVDNERYAEIDILKPANGSPVKIARIEEIPAYRSFDSFSIRSDPIASNEPSYTRFLIGIKKRFEDEKKGEVNVLPTVG